MLRCRHPQRSIGQRRRISGVRLRPGAVLGIGVLLLAAIGRASGSLGTFGGLRLQLPKTLWFEKKKKKKKIVRVWIHRCPTHYAHVSHAVAPIRSGERAPVLKFQAPPSLCRPQAATARACLPVPVPGAQQYVPILPGNTSLTFVSSSGLSSKVLPVRLAIATRPPMEVS